MQGTSAGSSFAVNPYLIFLQILDVDAGHPLGAVDILKHPQAVGIPEALDGAVRIGRRIRERVVEAARERGGRTMAEHT